MALATIWKIQMLKAPSENKLNYEEQSELLCYQWSGSFVYIEKLLFSPSIILKIILTRTIFFFFQFGDRCTKLGDGRIKIQNTFE